MVGQGVRQIAGATSLSMGGLAVIFGALWNIANMEDMGPRCLDGCAQSLLQYYCSVFEVSTIVVMAGIFACAVGIWSLGSSLKRGSIT